MIKYYRRLRSAFMLSAVALPFTSALGPNDFCSTITSCLKEGNTICNITSGDCPPCIYALDSAYTCWKKDNLTNTCPFTGVRYDCSDSWSSGSSNENAPLLSSVNRIDSTPVDLTPDSINFESDSFSSSSLSGINADASNYAALGELSSSLITYGAISFGAFLVLVILVILCARRRKIRYRREENIAATEAGNLGRNRAVSDRRLRGLTKPVDDTLSGPYNNILDTSKVNYTASNVNPEHDRGHKRLQPDSTEDSLSHVRTDESPHSVDGMLAHSPDSPALLGKKAGSYKSSRRSAQAAPVMGGIGKYSDVSEYVQQDVSFRCTSTPDVFGEYLRMKQEMQFDEGDGCRLKGMSFSDIISDLDSSKCSLESSEGTDQLPPQRVNRFSITDSIADSVTDSEYAEQLRARGESDCFSEMSYNDERYSFSSVEGLDDSQVRKSKREVEI